jgi:SAM-dependent methyltransferase
VRGYQREFSRDNAAMFDTEQRKRKAVTVGKVLDDYLDHQLSELDLVNIGSSTGVMDSALAGQFRSVTGIDIDSEAVAWAAGHFPQRNLRFIIGDAMNLPFGNGTIDAVLSTHVYEHVPDARLMFGEIYRVLRPGGVCYFAGNNRLCLLEPHYRLPLLSVLPGPLADLLMKLTGRGDRYYEKHLTYWGLLSLVHGFRVTDYTLRAVTEPGKYATGYMFRKGSMRVRLAGAVLRVCPWLSPGFIWVLEKPSDGTDRSAT